MSSKNVARRLYSPTVITDHGRAISTSRHLRTRATTPRGIAAAILAHIGPTNATLCGERYIAVEAYDSRYETTVHYEVR